MDEFSDCLGLFECSYCLQLFGSGAHLATHRRDVHGFTGETSHDVCSSNEPKPAFIKTEILVAAEVHEPPASSPLAVKTENVDHVVSPDDAALGYLKMENKIEDCVSLQNDDCMNESKRYTRICLKEEPVLEEFCENGVSDAWNHSVDNRRVNDIEKEFSDAKGRRRHCSLGDLDKAQGMTEDDDSKLYAGLAKRVRTEFTNEQLQILHSEYQFNTNPKREELERIAETTGLSRRVTQVWFQNSRALQRKNKMRKSDKGWNGSFNNSLVMAATIKSPIARISIAATSRSPIARISTVTASKSPIAQISTVTAGKSPIARISTVTASKSPIAQISTVTASKSPIAQISTAATSRSPIAGISTVTASNSPIAQISTVTAGKSPIARISTVTASKSPIAQISTVTASELPIAQISTAPNTGKVEQKLSQPNRQRYRRSRTSFTEKQLEILQTEFELDPKPLGKKLLHIARMTDLTRRVVQVWFQNSRALLRKSTPRRLIAKRLTSLSTRSNSSIVCSDDSDSSTSDAYMSILKRSYPEVADEAVPSTSVAGDAVNPILVEGDSMPSFLANSDSKPSTVANGDSNAEGDDVPSNIAEGNAANATASTSVKGDALDPTVANDSTLFMNDPGISTLIEDDAVPSTSKCDPKPASRLATRNAHFRGHYSTQKQRRLIHLSNRRKRWLKGGRTKFTDEQLQILQSEFQLDNRPSSRSFQRIAEITGLRAKVVTVWFQNSRALLKKSQTPHRSPVKKRTSQRCRSKSAPCSIAIRSPSTSSDSSTASNSSSSESAEVDKTQLAEDVMKNLELTPEFFIPILSFCGGDILQAVKMCFDM